MRCPGLAELPPPPPGRTGWPWTVETPPLPAARPDGSPWPRISIVTSSYNQGQFIEETIRSVLLQGYPGLEYIIIDGGSTDHSVEIIKKYAPWLTYWVSEKDRGQSHAISKGLAKSSGEIFQWINSDDALLPNALRDISTAFSGEAVAAPVSQGQTRTAASINYNRNLSARHILTGKITFAQPGLWLPRHRLVSIGFNENLHYAFDWDMVIRYLERYPKVTYIRPLVVFFRLHDGSKTIGRPEMFAKEEHLIRARLVHALSSPSDRAACRNAQHRINWARHLTEWRRKSEGAKFQIAIRMLLLGLRNPRLRINRFWAGALRRTLFA